MTGTDPCPNWPIGERAVERAYKLKRQGCREDPPGSNGGPFVRMLFEPATRRGRKLGITRGNWCAAFACHCVYQSLQPGEKAPIPYVVSGIELEQHAKQHGMWIPVEAVAAGAPIRVGDIAILRRGDPSRGAAAWFRHVAIVVKAVDGRSTYTTIGGNERDGIRETRRRMPGTTLGFIRLP